MHGARLGSRPVAPEAGGSPPPSTGAGWHEINTMLCLYPQETASMGEVILGGALGGGFAIQDVCSGFALPPERGVLWHPLPWLCQAGPKPGSRSEMVLITQETVFLSGRETLTVSQWLNISVSISIPPAAL